MKYKEAINTGKRVCPKGEWDPAEYIIKIKRTIVDEKGFHFPYNYFLEYGVEWIIHPSQKELDFKNKLEDLINE